MTHTGPFRLGISFHTFTEEYCAGRWSFEDMMELAAELGGGVEIVGPAHHRGFPSVTLEFERSFQSAVSRFGLTPVCYGSYADPFTLPDRDFSKDELVAYTIPQLHAAARLGFSIVRLQYFVHPVIERLLPLAAKLNLRLGYELHAPISFESILGKMLLAQVQRLDTPHLGLIPDCGIFGRSVPDFRVQLARQAGIATPLIDQALELWRRDVLVDDAMPILHSAGLTHEQLAKVEIFWGSVAQSDPAGLVNYAPHVIHVHGKYFSLQEGQEPDIRYGDIVQALLASGYAGWMSTEYEGPGQTSSFTIARAHQAMIRRMVASARAGSQTAGVLS